MAESTEVGHTSKENPTDAEDIENNDLDIHGNIRPSGVSTSQSVIPKPITSEESDREITDSEIIQVTLKSKSSSFCFNITFLFNIILL